MQRREFIFALGGAAAAWPIAARAQKPSGVRRVGVLIPFEEHDPEVQAFFPAFKQRLQDLGWTENRNIQFEYRFMGPNAERIRTGAAELVALAPDAILVWSNAALAILQPTTKTIPIVFALVSDPVGAGFVPNLAHPGGNITGFHNFETAIGGKWLELLKEIAPGMRRVAVVYEPDVAANVGFLHAAEAASASLGVAVTPVPVRVAADVEPALTAFASEPNGGFVATPNTVVITARDQIIALAAKLHLPAIYPFRIFAARGGLISYGLNPVEQQRGAASYVDRILRGAKPGDLPVQLPTKYEMAINLKTAKALGLDVSLQLQQRADDVIE